jgi:N-methylhydantoinase B
MESKVADPFTLEIIKNAMIALGDEMFYALQRTSKSPIIYETLDYAVGATDARGNIIAQGNGVTGFLGTLDGAVSSVLDKFGGDGLRPPATFSSPTTLTRAVERTSPMSRSSCGSSTRVK